jgi:hypothetical protein
VTAMPVFGPSTTSLNVTVQDQSMPRPQVGGGALGPLPCVSRHAGDRG